ncbi:MAG: PP0621 family protein [Rubrivivax sp.]|jgi:uncharacterized protein
MKYLLVLVVVVVGIWVLAARFRKSADPRQGRPSAGEGGAAGAASGPGADGAEKAAPRQIVACCHCGVHLPADEAVHDGSLPYCSPSHRQAGPR